MYFNQLITFLTDQFHIEPNNANGANAGIMVNEDQLCVCLNIEGEPKLVPVSKVGNNKSNNMRERATSKIIRTL